jgi:probable F420-dependent oxidoreductase
MRIGVTLGVDVPPAPVDLLATVRLIEQLGYSSFWLGDHVVIPRTVDADAHDRQVGGSVRIADKTGVDVFEPLVTMGWLAAQVERIRLGFGVLVVPYRNPVLAAKMLASLDVLSGGRIVLGAGSGWMEGEFDALNASYQERGAVTDEYLRAMLECWTSEHPSFHGEHYQLANIAFLPKPLQRPHLPVYIGGNSDRGLRRAVALGQGWLPLFHTPAELAPRLAHLARLCDAAGRDPGELTVIPSVRVRLRAEDDPDGPWSTRDLAAIRVEIEAYAALGIHELTIVIVEPDLDLDLLEGALRELSVLHS